MNKMDELVKKYCPVGVPFKKLNEISEMKRGTSITKKGIVKGDIPVISGGKMPAYYCDSYNRDGETITVAGSGAGAGYVQYWNQPIFVCDAFSIKGKEYVTTKYLYYCLSNMQEYIYSTKKGGGVPHVHISNIENIMFPVPPLEVQREIVRVLDSFTLLIAELTTELTARKKQYEFYRNKLLTYNGKYPMKPLSDLGKWSGGKTPSMAEKSFWENGTIPWISSKDMKESTLSDTRDHITEKAVEEVSMTVYPANSIAVVTRSGILKHTFPVAYVPFESTINQDIKMLVVNEDIFPRYAFHVIQGKGSDILVKTKKQGGTVDSLDFQKVLAYRVPVPPIDVQRKLVEVLDNFEAICTNLNIGLPAEIEARQKQYEYYRDLLLTFAETEKIVGGGYNENVISLIQYVFGYVILPMGSLFDFRNGLSKGKDFFGRGIPFIRYTDVYNNRFLRESDITALVECTLAEIEKLGVHRGDVFLPEHQRPQRMSVGHR